MALNAQALASVAEMKAELELAGDAQDLKLEKALNRATAWIEGQANRHFVTRGDVLEYHSLWDGRPELALSYYPTVAVASVYESWSLPPVHDATTLLTEGTDFQLDKPHGVLRRISSGALCPWASGYRAIKITHSYGFQKLDGSPAEAEPIPDDLKQLCLFVATTIFKESDRGRWGISSVTDAQGTVTRYLGYLPPDMKDVLVSYRRRVYDRTWEPG
jgi:hypothetical protein